MLRKFGFTIMLFILAVCLISGGCSLEARNMPVWEELKKISRDSYGKDILDRLKEKTKAGGSRMEDTERVIRETEKEKDTIKIKLYFAKSDKKGLGMEERAVERREGIARLTVKELIKGPEDSDFINIFPSGSRLLDINVKPDGVCIVDLSSEVSRVRNKQEERLLVYSLVNTLGQFPTIKKVVIRVEGEKVDTIAGYIKWPEAITPDYNI